jgi:prepilin-type N-terminal cleavage/methylation domain-containing protein
MRSRSRAYTLIELLIVIGVLGLAAAMLVPQMVGRDSMAVQAAVRQIIADLSFAQSDALARQEYRRVHFYEDGRGYCIVRVDETNYDNGFDEGLADYVQDPLASAGELGHYIVDYTMDPRFKGVSIVSVNIDLGGEGIGATGDDIVYDDLGGTVMAGNLPGIGGTIRIGAGADVFEVTVSPFTGKLTVSRV